MPQERKEYVIIRISEGIMDHKQLAIGLLFTWNEAITVLNYKAKNSSKYVNTSLTTIHEVSKEMGIHYLKVVHLSDAFHFTDDHKVLENVDRIVKQIY